MLGLVPSIHALRRRVLQSPGKGVDGRHKPDHDGQGKANLSDVRPSPLPLSHPGEGFPALYAGWLRFL
jgi:hypothetical protein